MNRINSHALGYALCLVAALALAGCGGDDGPPRFEVSGNVTYDGKPVPAGEVVLEPDGSAGNTGPGSFAMIKDGQYKTDPQKGAVGGPYIVRIIGYDGVAIPESSTGNPLFRRWETKVDLPDGPSKQDFEVPAEMALKQ